MKQSKIRFELFINNSFDSIYGVSSHADSYFQIRKTFEDIDAGTMALRKIDWERLGENIVKLHNSRYATLDSYSWLYPLLAEIEDYDVRISILEKLKNPGKGIIPFCPDYLFVENCDCIMKLIQELKRIKEEKKEHEHKHERRAYMLRKVFSKYPVNLWLNELVQVYKDENIDPMVFIALVQEMYYKEKGPDMSSIKIKTENFYEIIEGGARVIKCIPYQMKDGLIYIIDNDSQEDTSLNIEDDKMEEEIDVLSAILLSYRHIGKLWINNGIDLCKYILVAEDIRQQLLNATQDYPKPSLKTLNRKLRNACFDLFIHSRFEKVKAELDADNTLQDDPTEIQVYDKLYSDESETIKQEKLTHPDNIEIIELAEYLLDRIKKNTSHASTPKSGQTGSTINVQGDLVQGNKYVGTHIDNVSPNAIGAQTKEV